jgi:hypothetical protein
MPTRTINLKMLLSRKEDGKPLRQALWMTHFEVNRAVAEVERILLLLRASPYVTLKDSSDPESVVNVTEGEITKSTLRFARSVQKRNGKADAGSDEDILKALFALYKAIVPTIDPDGKGDAQAANAFISPLMDPKSEGGMGAVEKYLDPSPDWIEKMENGRKGWEKASETWLKTEEAQSLMTMPGSPPGWIRRYRKGEPWQEAFVKAQAKYKSDIDEGNTTVTLKLKKLGLLPIMKPMINEQLRVTRGNVSPWDRMAVRLAVAHLLSWESWNHATRDAYEKRKKMVRKAEEEVSAFMKEIDLLRSYETDRHRELKKVAFTDDKNPFRIKRRTIRAWEKVFKKWEHVDNTEVSRCEVLSELQTQLRGKFGDPHLFRWLAKPGNERLWRNQLILPSLARLNGLQALLDRTKKSALFTFADAQLHPRWCMFEAPGGTNLRKYSLEQDDGQLRVNLSLLCAEGDHALSEKEFSVRLAPSGQMSDVELTKAKKKLDLKFESAHQTFESVAGGSEILFERSLLEHCYEEDLADGRFGPVWFKLTADIRTKAPAEWLDGKGRTKTPAAFRHFMTSLVKKSSVQNSVIPGMRVLSVDLGLRTFASCSVFFLTDEQPSGKLAYGTDIDGLWAVHERSFLLNLPGEKTTQQKERERREAMDELRFLKRDIRRLGDFLRLGEVSKSEADERKERWKTLHSSRQDDPVGSAFDIDVIKSLEQQLGDSDPRWQRACKEAHAIAEAQVSTYISDWRKRTRPRSTNWDDWRDRRSYGGGKSIWALEYYDNLRRLLTSWSLRAREYGQVNRLSLKERGVFAKGLLMHINNLKNDRIKSGADLIIQAARGFIYHQDANRWEDRFDPCQVILFEDLARYRFRTDRPRWENSQLMKWNHREIIRETELQAELYGMRIHTTAAGFSSRFHAATGAPGVRCRTIDESCFENGQLKEFAARRLEWMGEKMLATLKEGDLVPWEGGEMFVTIRKNRSPVRIHADINAAQNLQKRFWKRSGEGIRVGCVKIVQDGTEIWIPERDNVQLRSGLLGLRRVAQNGYARFESDGNGNFVADGISQQEWRSMVKEKQREDVEDLKDDELADIMALHDFESTGERETLFRDPSGVFFGSPEHWLRGGEFWARVRWQVWKALCRDSPARGHVVDHSDDDIPF